MTGANLHNLNLGNQNGRPISPDPTQHPVPQGQQPHQQQADEQQQQQPEERDALVARLQQLEEELVAARLQNQGGAPGASTFDMFATQSTLDALATKDGPKKAIAPIIPGFKADALAGVLPPKLDTVIANYQYLPYTALTRAARIKASRGEETVIITAAGLTSKGIDRSGERNISVLDWMDAAKIHADRIRHHHGDSHADALLAHHANVLALAHRQGAEAESWPIAIAYDIHQREAAAAHPGHDLAPLDTRALQLVTNQVLVARLTALSSPQPSSSGHLSKRASQGAPPSATAPWKRVRTQAPACFRCGEPGHLPKDCTASRTRAGKEPARIGTDNRHPNALISAEGKQYCFRWSKDSTCSFATGCHHLHACSICLSTSHGAQSCAA